MEPRSPARFSLERMPRWLAPLAGHPYDPDTLRSVPSWGLSVLLHALLLLVLALLIRVGTRQGLELRRDREPGLAAGDRRPDLAGRGDSGG